MEARVPVGPCKVRALFSWAGESKKDLGFVEGDLIDVLQTNEGDWWTGRLVRNRVVGLFPRNYVEYCDPNQATVPHPSSRSLQSSQTSQSTNQTNFTTDLFDDTLHQSQPFRSSATSHGSFHEPLNPLRASAASAASGASAKSTEEILKDIALEINRVSAHLPNNDNKARTYDDRLAARAANEFKHLSQHIQLEDLETESRADAAFIASFNDPDQHPEAPASPAPPPHRVPLNQSQNSLERSQNSRVSTSGHSDMFSNGLRVDSTLDDLLQPLETMSPDLGEIPFDPRAFAPMNGLSAPLSHMPNATNSFDQEPLPQSPLSAQSSPKAEKSSPGKRNLVKKLWATADVKEKLWFNRPEQQKASIPPVGLNLGIEHMPKLNNHSTSEQRSSNNYSTSQSQPDWMILQRNLYRSKTPTEHEKSGRLASIEREGIPIADVIAVLKASQSVSPPLDQATLHEFENIDQEVMSESTWPTLMTPAILAQSRFGRSISGTLNRARAIFDLLATHITPLPSHSLRGFGPVDDESMKELMKTKRADALLLAVCAREMCIAVNVDCRVIRGRLRSSEGDLMGEPHAWNAAKDDDGRWRLFDCWSANNYGAIEDYWFATDPQQFLSTHLPDDSSDQQLQPPLSSVLASALPVSTPAAWRLQAHILKWGAADGQIRDLSLVELSVTMPNLDFKIVANVNSTDYTVESARSAISQPFWDQLTYADEMLSGAAIGTRRLYSVKALLPHGAKNGVLRLWAKSIATHNQARLDHPQLLYSIPLVHQGLDEPFEFVETLDCLSMELHDIRIREPLCRDLAGGQQYLFRIDQHPLKAGSQKTFVNLALSSPSGRISKLVPRGADASDTYSASIRTLEVGDWSAVIAVEEGQWKPFARWRCR